MNDERYFYSGDGILGTSMDYWKNKSQHSTDINNICYNDGIQTVKNWFGENLYCNNCNTIAKRKESDNMSFVGLLLFDKAILAFGDSKSTIKDEFGNMREEKGRKVQKVFRFHENIVVAYGLNEISDNDGNRILLEDFINQQISNGKNVIEMLYALYDVTEGKIQRGNVFEFLIGGFDKGETYIQYAFLDADRLIVNRKTYAHAKRNLESNTPIFVTWFEELLKTCRTDITPEEMEGFIRNELEEKIREIERTYPYSTVGLPLQIEIMKFQTGF